MMKEDVFFKYLEKRSIQQLYADMNELNAKIKREKQQTRAPKDVLLSLTKAKTMVRQTIDSKEEERFDEEDIANKRKDEQARKELLAYLDKISHCPKCPATFDGPPAEKERTRREHIKKHHPELKLFKI